MKNLKKVLALVLAIACAFTMFAGAAFTDEADIQATDAVNMLTALGVIEGFEDGSFQPDGTVTRAQMAKMIFVVRNNKIDDTAYKNNSTQFTDVNDNWAAGYIKFCESQGIIAGKSATQFKPNDTVTGVEAAKMLLVVAGYDPDKAGLTGANWKTNTLKWAGSAGLLDDVNAPLEEGLPRQYAAQVIYNALDANRVKWSDDSNSFDDVLNGGVKETVGKAYMKLYKTTGILASISRDSLELTGIDRSESDAFETSFTKVQQDYSEYLGQKVKVMFKDGKTNSVMGVYPVSDNTTYTIPANGTGKDGDRIKFDGKTYPVELDQGGIVTYVDGRLRNPTTLDQLDTNDLNPNMYTLVDSDGNGKLDTLIVKTYNVAQVTYISSDRIIANGQTYKFDEENIDSNIEKDDWVVITENLYQDCKDIIKADVGTGTLDGLRDSNTNQTVYFDITGTKTGVKYNEYKLGDNWIKGGDGVVQNTTLSENDLNSVKAGNSVEYVEVNNILFYIKRTSGTGTGRVADVALVVDTDVAGIRDEVKLAFFDGTTATVNVDSDSEVKATALQAGVVYEYDVSGNEYSFKNLVSFDQNKAYENYYGDLSYRTGTDGVTLTGAKLNSNHSAFNGLNIDDDAQVLLYLSKTRATDGKADTKKISGKQFKAMDGAKILTAEKAYGFSGDMNGLTRIGALAVEVKDLANIAKTWSNYGYIVEKASKQANGYVEYTIWNGSENVTVQEKKNSVNEREKGRVIGYDTLDTKDNKNIIDDVTALTKNDITYTAITDVNNAQTTVSFAAKPVYADLMELDVEGTLMTVDTDADSWTDIGVVSGKIGKANKTAAGKWKANALVIGNGGDTELLIVDVGEFLKNDIYSVDGTDVVKGTDSSGSSGTGDNNEVAELTGVSVNNNGVLRGELKIDRSTWIADNTTVTVGISVKDADGNIVARRNIELRNTAVSVLLQDLDSTLNNCTPVNNLEANESVTVSIDSVKANDVKVRWFMNDGTALALGTDLDSTTTKTVAIAGTAPNLKIAANSKWSGYKNAAVAGYKITGITSTASNTTPITLTDASAVIQTATLASVQANGTGYVDITLGAFTGTLVGGATTAELEEQLKNNSSVEVASIPADGVEVPAGATLTVTGAISDITDISGGGTVEIQNTAAGHYYEIAEAVSGSKDGTVSVDTSNLPKMKGTGTITEFNSSKSLNTFLEENNCTALIPVRIQISATELATVEKIVGEKIYDNGNSKLIETGAGNGEWPKSVFEADGSFDLGAMVPDNVKQYVLKSYDNSNNVIATYTFNFK